MEELDFLVIFGISRPGQLDDHGQEVLCIEPRGNPHLVQEAAHQKSRTDQENDGQGDLRDDHHTPNPRPGRSSRRGSPPILQSRLRAGRCQRRQQTEDHAGHQ